MGQESDLYIIKLIHGKEKSKVYNVWDQKDLDDRSRSVLVYSCYEFEMED